MDKWQNIQKGPFEPCFDSLRQYQCPEWFRDAKFGVWSHWGPQSVPMFGDWYARNMYREETDQYIHHWRVYGHPSRHGWKDVVKLWKAEKFDPDALMERYVNAGAKYFCAQAIHHDNFDNWNSKHNRWNAVNMGPQKDIVRLWQSAAQKYNLPFGVTEHLGATFSWWSHNKGQDIAGPYAGVPYDGIDPEYQDLYLPNQDEPRLANQGERWYTTNPWWHQHWFDRIKDLVDQIHPDLLYSDGTLPFAEYGMGIVAHLYNTSIADHGTNQAVYTQKDKNPLVYKVGVLDIERNVLADNFPYPWQTDTCVGGWFYDVRRSYKTAQTVIEMLVDIVAKNGNLLLNFTQRPDGTLDDECLQILDDMAGWNRTNAEAIYGTRPWHIAMEGHVNASQERFREDALVWTPADYRFTSKGKAVYAFQMAWPTDGHALIRSFTTGSGGYRLKVADVEKVQLLGYGGQISFNHTDQGLELSQLPEHPPVSAASCFKITTR
ncbi:MAG: alpha-L-fucosidase [Anaerolineae bacterium]|nr:alpha-L-fucosidase [Anaerolineae bacterium]